LLRQVDAIFAPKAVVPPNLASLQNGRFALWYQPIWIILVVSLTTPITRLDAFAAPP
jgi:hypothetical protein